MRLVLSIVAIAAVVSGCTTVVPVVPVPVAPVVYQPAPVYLPAYPDSASAIRYWLATGVNPYGFMPVAPCGTCVSVGVGVTFGGHRHHRRW